MSWADGVVGGGGRADPAYQNSNCPANHENVLPNVHFEPTKAKIELFRHLKSSCFIIYSVSQDEKSNSSSDRKKILQQIIEMAGKKFCI